MLSHEEKLAKWENYIPSFSQRCNRCEWEITVEGTGKELESCPTCNSTVNSILHLGGASSNLQPCER
mgnify:CR=1 FL=1